jgi:hypothetical protein
LGHYNGATTSLCDLDVAIRCTEDEYHKRHNDYNHTRNCCFLGSLLLELAWWLCVSRDPSIQLFPGGPQTKQCAPRDTRVRPRVVQARDTIVVSVGVACPGTCSSNGCPYRIGQVHPRRGWLCNL